MRHSTVFSLLLTSGIALAGCSANQQDTSLETNRAVVKKYHQVWSSGQLTELDHLLSTDFVYHTTSGKDYQGIGLAKEAVTKVRSSFPDLKEEIVDMVTEGDKVVTRYKTTGTRQGKYKDVDATGKKVVLYEASVYRLANGKIAEEWVFGDSADLDKQLNPQK